MVRAVHVKRILTRKMPKAKEKKEDGWIGIDGLAVGCFGLTLRYAARPI
jgi:hypothetical protein